MIRGCVVLLVLLWMAGGVLGARPIARLAYTGSDAHVAASLTGRADGSAGGELARVDEVTLGTRFSFELRVEAEAGVEVLDPDAGLLLGPGMVVESVGERVERGLGGGARELSWVIVGSPVSLGRVELGGPVVRYELAGGERGEVRLGPDGGGGWVVVGEIGGEPSGLSAASEAAGVRGPAGGRWLSVVLWGVLLGVVAVAVLVGLGFVAAALVRRSVAREEMRRRAPGLPRPAVEVALERLAALERGLSCGEVSAASGAAGACDVARGYLGDRFGLRAPRMTTREFLEAARCRGDVGWAAGELGELLERADRIKFAGSGARLEEASRAVAVVRGFVERTGGAGFDDAVVGGGARGGFRDDWGAAA